MAATVQSDAYASLSRKIGYSAGLEHLAERAAALTNLYVGSEAGIRFTDWKYLVEEVFKRNSEKSPAYEHIANFFFSLGLIRLVGNEIHTQPRLETLSILARYFEGSRERFEVAARFVLLLSVIEADADIFLNCLAGEFQRNRVRASIAKLIELKWGAISRLVANPAVQERLWEVISIRSQPSSRGSGAKKSPKPSPFAPRTQALDSLTVRKAEQAASKSADVPDSYLDKILPTRKGWAKDFGLSDREGVLTAEGRVLLQRLSDLGLREEGGPFVVWPYAHDMALLRMSYEDLGARGVTEWELSQAVQGAFTGVQTELTPIADEELLLMMRECFELYRSADSARGVIRHQIPLYVLKPALQGIFLAERRITPNIPDFIEREIKGVVRRFDLTNVRGTEGAIVFR